MPFFSRLLATAAPLVLVAAAVHADVVISSGTTQNMSCFNGVCAPTASDAILNVADLEVLLASGATEVTTTGAGVQVNDIVVSDAITWTSANALTLNAYRSITIDKPVSVDGAAGLVLTTDDGDTNGALLFGPKGNVTFQNLASPLTINGTAYTLESTLKTLAQAIAVNPAGAFALASDYNAKADGIYQHSPISTTLTGELEGLGNEISNLMINDRKEEETVGLLSVVETSGSVQNLPLSIRIRSLNNIHGVVGGLVGVNFGTLSGDRVAGHVEVGHTAFGESLGGAVGDNGGTIERSSAVGSVSALNGNSGGLVGHNSGVIDLARAEARVSGLTAGGLVGENEGTIAKSFAMGAVRGDCNNCAPRVGGLVGASGGAISNSYATGSVADYGSSMIDYVGGFMGNGSGNNSTSYETGAVSGDTYIGGFLGYNDSKNSKCYWDTTINYNVRGVGGGYSFGITGATTEQLQSGLPAGFDPKIWAENPKVNNGFPYLIANPPPK